MFRVSLALAQKQEDVLNPKPSRTLPTTRDLKTFSLHPKPYTAWLSSLDFGSWVIEVRLCGASRVSGFEMLKGAAIRSGPDVLEPGTVTSRSTCLRCLAHPNT